jgi:signal peptidase II
MLVLCVSFSIALLDQVTKHLIRLKLLSGTFTVIPGFFDLHYVQNTGAAWGIMQGLNSWLVLFSIVMLVLIIAFRKSFFRDSLVNLIAMGLMVGGIVGNLIDRVKLGYVVDFLDFYWRSHHFPAFNVADSAICSGVALFILSQVFDRKDAVLK